MRFLSIVLLAGALTLPLAHVATAQTSNAAGLSAQFTTTDKEEVPGQTLKPGDYNISILDSLRGERFILRIDSLTSKSHTIFLGVPGARPSTTAGTYLWNGGLRHRPALRGFAFPSGLTVDFVYPKADAAELSKANPSGVPAVDYASDHLKPESGLNGDDLREVNLWMLSPTTAGPVNHPSPAILAKRYEAPAAPVQQAVVTSPVSPRQTQIARLEQPSIPQAQPSPIRVAHRARVLAVLPHTASLQPVVWLGAMSSILVGLLLFSRLYMTRTDHA